MYSGVFSSEQQCTQIGVLASEGWWDMTTLVQGNQELLAVKDKVGRPPGELGVSTSMECDIFPSVLWHCWGGDRKGIRPVKSRVLVCWWWWFDWSFVRLIAVVVTTTSTSIILCFDKHRLTHVHVENGGLNGESNNVLRSLQYFDTVGWVTGRTSDL